jgi:hypothetical protein
MQLGTTAFAKVVVPRERAEDRVTDPAALRRARFALLSVALLLSATWLWRWHLLEEQMPYPGHMDERRLNRHALDVARSGSLAVDWFEYPSLPIYLCSFGMRVGTALSLLSATPVSADEIGSVGHPYYSHPEVMRYPRLLFITLGVLSLLFAGLGARELTGRSTAVVAAPLFALLSPNLFATTSEYINVDTAATFFCARATWFALSRLGSDDVRSKVLVPALICGAAGASKYNSALIMAPFLIAIGTSTASWQIKIGRAAALGILSVAAFICFAPYSVIRWSKFVSDVMVQVKHYRGGHRGYEAEPGWDQLTHYAGLLADEFGLVACCLAVFALIEGYRRDRRKLLVAASFPALMILYMSTNRVNFTRTVLPIFPAVAMLMATGASYVLDRATSLFMREGRGLPWPAWPLRWGSSVLLASAVAMAAPLAELWREHTPQPDSRIIAGRWIEQNVPLGSAIIYSSRLDWDTRSLEPRYDMVAYKAKPADGLKHAAPSSDGAARYLVTPVGEGPTLEGVALLVRLGSNARKLDRSRGFVNNPPIEISIAR